MNKAKLVNNRILIKKKSIHKMIMHFFFSLLLLYAAKDVFYSAGPISQSVLIIYLGLSSFYFIKTLIQKNKKNSFYKAWTALLFLNIIGFIFTGSINISYSLGMFLGVLISLLTFYPFYFFASNGTLESKHIINFFLLMFLISIFQYFHNMNKILYERLDDNTDLVNNVSFMFVNLIPYVFLIKKRKILSFIAVFVIMFFIIQGAKRGAIITGISGVLIFIYYLFRTFEKKYRHLSYLLLFIGSFLMFHYFYNLFISNDFLINRFENLLSSGGSGRDRIFNSIFTQWYFTDDILKSLFGFGFASSIQISGGFYAHNDWLELLSNFGLLGVSIYLWIFYSGFKLLFKDYLNMNMKVIVFAVLIIWFLTSLFSMGYPSTEGYMRGVIIAYALGISNLNKKEIK